MRVDSEAPHLSGLVVVTTFADAARQVAVVATGLTQRLEADLRVFQRDARGFSPRAQVLGGMDRRAAEHLDVTILIEIVEGHSAGRDELAFLRPIREQANAEPVAYRRNPGVGPERPAGCTG